MNKITSNLNQDQQNASNKTSTIFRRTLAQLQETTSHNDKPRHYITHSSQNQFNNSTTTQTTTTTTTTQTSTSSIQTTTLATTNNIDNNKNSQQPNIFGSPFTRPDFLKRHTNKPLPITSLQQSITTLSIQPSSSYSSLSNLTSSLNSISSSLPRSTSAIFQKNRFPTDSPLPPLITSNIQHIPLHQPPCSSSSNSPSNQSNMTFSSVAKPIIHHITSPANQSILNPIPITHPLPKNDSSLYAGSIHNISIDSTQQNHSGITGGLVLRPGDVWSQVVLRVIPLFNGEGHNGFIEDLNTFVSQHIHKTIADSPSKSITKLYSDITELFANGIIILNNKLQPDHLSDERLLVRIFEVWHFFFTGVLPYLEAIFLPLMTDDNLLSVIESKNNKDLQERLQQQHLLQQATSNARLFGSTSTLFRPSNRNPQNPTRHQTTGSQSSRAEELVQEIDIRKLALLAFRQHLCLPIFPRLYNIFTMLYDPTTWEKLYGPINLSMDIQSEQMHLKRLQMIGLLSSVQLNDGQVPITEELSKLIRLKKANPELLKPLSTSLKNLPLRTASFNSDPVTTSPRKSSELGNRSERDRSGSSSSLSHPQQQRPSRMNSNPSNLGSTQTSEIEYDEDRPVVKILQDDNPSQQIKGWNKNRGFARRSIRRQLSKSGTNSRATRENQDPQYQQHPPREEQLDPTTIKPERRIRRNRATQSISRVLEDGNPDSSMNRSVGMSSMVPSSSSVSTQTTQRTSVDRVAGDEQALKHLNENAYDAQTEWSLGHRTRMVFGPKTGSGSSSGSIISIMGPPKQIGAGGPYQSNNNTSTVYSKSTINRSVDELDHGLISSATGADCLIKSSTTNATAHQTTKPLVIHQRLNNLHNHHPSHTSTTISQPQMHSSQLNLNIQPVRSTSISNNTPSSHTRSLSASQLNHQHHLQNP